MLEKVLIGNISMEENLAVYFKIKMHVILIQQLLF